MERKLRTLIAQFLVELEKEILAKEGQAKPETQKLKLNLKRKKRPSKLTVISGGKLSADPGKINS
jgi:hypothetical protein